MATATPASEHFTLRGPGEYVIRHGAAEVIHEAKPLGYTGRLDTPRQFLDKKRAAPAGDGGLRYVPYNASFVVDEEKNTVTLYLNEWDTPSDTITGQLVEDPNFKKFALNTDKRWSINELWLFLKQMGHFFPDKEAHKAFLANLRSFSSKVSTAVQASHDNSGNRKASYERVVEENSLSNNPFFTLNVPLFQGYDALTFPVEVGFDPTDAGVSIFLVSDQLFELLATERATLVKQEIDYFTDWGCSVLIKS